ncbi:MAG TPA: prolyl oligopeptidase family serine peptidase [Acidobacteriota bacterium]|nr:prolyl oligopeptidase family serine peptidase [Acidobacteriota bacterium]
MTIRPLKLSLWVLLLWLPLQAAGEEADKAKSEKSPVEIGEILMLGPVRTPLRQQWPGTRMKEGEVQQMLATLGDDLPRPGDSLSIFGQEYAWTSVSPNQGLYDLEGDQGGFWVASLMLDVERWSQADLKLRSPSQPSAFLDAKAVSLSGGDEEEKAWAGGLKMIPGTHRLLIMASAPSDQPSELRLMMESAHADAIRPYIEPEQKASKELLYGAAQVRSLSLSPDGEHVLLSMRERNTLRGRWESRLEIRRFSDGGLVRQWVADAPGGIRWSPDGRWISYITRENGKSDLWVQEGFSAQPRRLLEGLENLGSYRWMPDSSSLVFAWTKDAEERKDGFKHYRDLPDRWRGWRNRAQLYQVDLRSGWIQQLTDGDWGAGLEDLSPDSQRLLYSRVRPDYREAPYQLTTLHELSLKDGEEKQVGNISASFGGARYWKEQLLVWAAPQAFEGAGVAVPEGLEANQYDTQLFLYDPSSSNVTALSRDFDPSISSVEPDPQRGVVILTAATQDRPQLYRLDVDSMTYTPIPSPASSVADMDYSPKSGRLLWEVTSATVPQKILAADSPDSPPRLIAQPMVEAFSQVRLGEYQRWNFESSRGQTILGRFYTPPGFEPSRKYPLIVYYYGGTVPVNDVFTSRYPWHLWAANGYVVYVPQPSGAIGFGQDFSALHVNGWGAENARDIIEGAQKFIAAHEFVDGRRVGCIGASYGGYMTQFLITQTDLFAAAVSHAGISALSSYWGEGWWGYLYSGIATHGSFPWNRPDLYTERSPLFMADKISTPLLLLHGEADTNVPVGESQQMYTALKLLNKEVELVTIAGSDHQIFDWDKRMVWWDSIVAWFDKHLKGQEEWWNAIYPE